MENQISQTYLSPKQASRMQMQNSDRSKKYEPVSNILNRNIRDLQMKRFSQNEEFEDSMPEIEQEPQCNISFQCIQEGCSKIVASAVFYYIYMIVMLIFMISCLLWDPTQNQELSTVAQNIQLTCHVLFLLIFLIKAIEWKSQKIFWLIFDFILIICGIVSYSLESGQALRYMKAIRTLRLIFLIKQVKFLNEPTTHLMTALAKVGQIMIPAVIIIYAYALVGLYSFSDYEYSKCRTPDNKLKTSDWTVYSSQIFLCGERECPIYDNTQLECLNPIDYNVPPTETQLVNMVQGNGLLNYSNILYAFLSTLKQTFGTGSSRLILLYKQVLNPVFVLIYFYSYIYLISYIYLNIFFSLIIIAEWDNEEQKEEESDRSRQKIQNDFDLVEDDKKITKKKIVTKKAIEKKQSNLTNLNSDNGTPQALVLQKTKIHNIFEEVQDSPVVSNDNNHLKLQTPETQEENKILEEDQDTTLSDKHPKFFCGYIIFSDLIILLTCVNLALEFNGQTDDFEYVVSLIDFCFYIFFIFQVLFKILIYKKVLGRIQLGAKIDIAILVLCTAGIIYEAVIATNLKDFVSTQNPVEKIFRSFKYLRIFVLILQTPFFKQSRLILTSTIKAIHSIKNLILLWFLIVLIIAIMGFHLHSYKTKVDSNGNLDLTNGSSFQVSMDGMFQSVIFTMLTFYNEEWDYLMFQQYLGSGALVVIWQLISLIVGLMLFSKYFMALLMNQLQTLLDGQKVEEEEDDELQSDLIPDDLQQEQKEKLEEKMEQSHMRISNKIEPENYVSQKKTFRMTKKVSFNIANKNMKEQAKVKKKKTMITPQSQQNQNDDRKRTVCLKNCVSVIRRAIEHQVFNIIKVLFILLSCLVLINTHPQVNRSSTEAEPYLILDKVAISFFLLELIAQLIVYGLFQDPNSYLRRSWLNWFNIVIIVIQILSFTSLSSETIFQKIERFKVFRILFFVELKYKTDWNMRITYHAFIQLLPKVFNLLAITIIFYMYFALILVKMYKDDFFYCQNHYSSATISTMQDCLSWGGDWIQRSMNTANLFNSTIFLFLVATTQGWITLMQWMMDLNGENNVPSYNVNQYINIFFVFFFFFGNLILLNVFVGLSISNFKRLKEKTTGESKLTKKQKMWLSVKQQIYRLQPLVYEDKPENVVRGKAYEISKSKIYKVIKGIFFLGFVVCISFFHSNMSNEEETILKYTLFGFVGIMIFEEIIELLAYGIRMQYKKTIILRNIVIIYCIIYMIIDAYVTMDAATSRILGATFVTLQFLRYLLLLNQITFARKLMNGIATVLPRTVNILLLISITLFIYTIFGMELFSFLRYSVQLDEYNQNYTNFGNALFALVKFSTLQSPIQQIIDAAQTNQPNFVCQQIFSYSEFLQYGQNGCGSQAWSYIFFLSFHIFYSLLLMSTFLAVIVDSYSEVKKEQNAFITKFVLEKVRKLWSKIDPEASGFIPYRQFWMFTSKLLGIYMGQEVQKKEKKDLKELFSSKEELLRRMAIPIYENENGVLCFQFHEVIEGLTRIYIQNSLNEEIKSKKAQQMFKERQSGAGIGFKRSYYTSSHVSTLIILKSGLRWWKNLATSDTGPLQYKLIMQKFSEDKKPTQ